MVASYKGYRCHTADDVTILGIRAARFWRRGRINPQSLLFTTIVQKVSNQPRLVWALMVANDKGERHHRHDTKAPATSDTWCQFGVDAQLTYL
jgi:hypothetical protein